jgi:hypothetical protein
VGTTVTNTALTTIMKTTTGAIPVLIEVSNYLHGRDSVVNNHQTIDSIHNRERRGKSADNFFNDCHVENFKVVVEELQLLLSEVVEVST